MGRINHRACPRHMCRQTRHHPSHRRVAVYQRKMFPLHQITHLTVHQTILRIKGTSDKINLMPYDPGSIQAMIIRAIGRRMKIRSIVNLIPHLLQNPHIVHLKLRKKAAHVGNQKGLADRYLPLNFHLSIHVHSPCSSCVLLPQILGIHTAINHLPELLLSRFYVFFVGNSNPTIRCIQDLYGSQVFLK